MNLTRALINARKYSIQAAHMIQKDMSPSQPLNLSVAANRPFYPTDFDATRAIVDGYKASAWVFACINRIATALSSVPWTVLERKGKDDWEVNESHPITALLESPNEKMTMKTLMYWQCAWLLAVGNSIFRTVKINDKRKSVAELWPFAPRNVAPIPSDDWVIDFEYHEENQKKILPADEAIHVMIPNPDNILWGCGPLQTVWKAVQTDVAGSKMRQQTFAAGGVPIGAITDDSIETTPQYNKAKDLMRQSWNEASGSQTPMLLTKGKGWLNFSVSARDLQYLEGRQFTVYEITTAFGLLPAMFDPGAATYDNLTASIRWMWDNPVAAALDIFEDAFNLALLTPEERKDTWIHYDLSTIKALQHDSASKIAGIAQAIASGVAPDDAYQLFDLNVPIEGEDGKVRLMNGGLVRLADLVKEPEEVAAAEPMTPNSAGAFGAPEDDEMPEDQPPPAKQPAEPPQKKQVSTPQEKSDEEKG